MSMRSADWERLRPMARVTARTGLRSPELPRNCPDCGRRLVWGWSQEEFSERCDTDRIHLFRIPRPDQTVFCPNCEARILN